MATNFIFIASEAAAYLYQCVMHYTLQYLSRKAQRDYQKVEMVFKMFEVVNV